MYFVTADEKGRLVVRVFIVDFGNVPVIIVLSVTVNVRGPCAGPALGSAFRNLSVQKKPPEDI